MTASTPAQPELWGRIDALIDCSPPLLDLQAHGVHLLAARRWRLLGRPVPEDVVHAERTSAMVALAAPALLAEIRSVCDGPLVVLKGPAVAVRYPDPSLRPYGDVDVLVADADAVQARLVRAGFRLAPHPSPDSGPHHHLPPLGAPRFPLRVEVHRSPSWIDGLHPPSTAELLARAQPAAIGVDGIAALPPADHAVLVAVHAWKHEPLGRLLHLIDVAVLAAQADRSELEAIAEAWGVGRLWSRTIAVVDALLFTDGSAPWLVRPPLRKLRRVRERTVLESHLYRALGAYWALPPGRAVRASAVSLSRALRPQPGEAWITKLRRALTASRHAFMRRSEHERVIGYRP